MEVKVLLHWWTQECAGVVSSGVVGIRLNDGQIEIIRLKGCAPDVKLLYPLLKAALPDEMWEEAERQHRSRSHPWRVDVRVGMSGARDYFIRVLVDPEWGLTCRGGSLHVSMWGRLNQDVRVPLQDLPPLLARVLMDFPPGRAEIQRLKPATEHEFHTAGEPSGLQSILEAQRILDTLTAAGGEE